jgi:DNA-binding HxlR family transcriptional regulator
LYGCFSRQISRKIYLYLQFASANIGYYLQIASIFMKKDEGSCHRSACAISMALEAIGDKWSLLILRDLMFTDKRSYGELQSSDEKIATNILAARLQSLEANGLIRKSVDPDNGRRSLYYLTEKGIDLLPVIIELRQWTEKHNPEAEGCANALKLTDKNRKEVLAVYKKKLKAEHCKK